MRGNFAMNLMLCKMKSPLFTILILIIILACHFFASCSSIGSEQKTSMPIANKVEAQLFISIVDI